MTTISKPCGQWQVQGAFRRPLTVVANILLAAFIGLGSSMAHAQTGALGNTERSIGPRCPPGAVLGGGRCVRPDVKPQCPPATIGQYPNCRPAVRSFCPRGTAGVYPNCRPSIDLPPPLDGPRLQPMEPPRARIYRP